jgi:two-component system KDP operon response regulator KdpE
MSRPSKALFALVWAPDNDARPILKWLGDRGVAVTVTESFERFAYLCRASAPAMVVLVTGEDVNPAVYVHHARRYTAAPMLVIGAMTEYMLRACYSARADYVLQRPYEVEDLGARLEVLAWRAQWIVGGRPESKRQLVYAGLIIDLGQRMVKVGDEDWEHWPNAEFEVLTLLASGRRVCSKEELSRVVLNTQASRRAFATIRKLVHRLRRRLRDDVTTPRYIETRWGIGYAWLQPEIQP